MTPQERLDANRDLAAQLADAANHPERAVPRRDRLAAGHFPADKTETLARALSEQITELTGRPHDYRDVLDVAATIVAYRPFDPLPFATSAIAEARGSESASVASDLIARGAIPSKEILEHIAFAADAVAYLDGRLYDKGEVSPVAKELREWVGKFR